jgi:hypothetical protein
MVDVVDPSDVVVTTLNLSFASSQYKTAGFDEPLLINIPEDVAWLEPEFNVKILSSTDRLFESIVVVVPTTDRSPVIRTSPDTSNLYAPGEVVPIPTLIFVTSKYKRFVSNARSTPDLDRFD